MLDPWPYPPFEPAHDVTIGGVRRIVQLTEDGYYGFGIVGGEMKLSMVGPERDAETCMGILRRRILRNGLQDR